MRKQKSKRDRTKAKRAEIQRLKASLRNPSAKVEVEDGQSVLVVNK